VRVDQFEVATEPGSYFLLLMRLVGWKRPDIAVEACSRLGLRLVVAGDGREMDRLKAMAGPSIEFVGRVGDAAIRQLLAGCKALILPSEEDFGITPLEAMASGRPVIAYGAGGALDTVVAGATGAFFEAQTSDSLADVLRLFDERDYSPAALRRHAEHFDSAVFAAKLRRLVHERANEHFLRVAAEACPLDAPSPVPIRGRQAAWSQSMEITNGASL
jgi:glycosyltransferase involved in cell wall biosynthesis